MTSASTSVSTIASRSFPVKAAYRNTLFSHRRSVDSDQAGLNPDLADFIPTSALKNVGTGLARSIKLDMVGKLAYGSAETLGFAQNGVELLNDDHYQEMVSEEIRAQVAELQEKIASGEIEVYTTAGANGMDSAAIEELKASVAVK